MKSKKIIKEFLKYREEKDDDSIYDSAFIYALKWVLEE